MIFNKSQLLLFILILITLSSCKYYKQDIMFKTDTSINEDALVAAVDKAKVGYRIRKGDVVSFQLYTNKGEVMIDPNSDLARQLGSGKLQTAKGGDDSFTRQERGNGQTDYLVDSKGYLFLPMIGKLYVDSLTHNQFDSTLSVKYGDFYQEPFIISKVNSNKVVILNGLRSSVLTVGSRSINLIEAIGSIGGVEEFSKVKKIRLIRGDLKNPSVQLIDLSTIAGLKKANLTLLPDDIIYIEPGRNATQQTIKDYAPYLNIVVSILALSLFYLR